MGNFSPQHIDIIVDTAPQGVLGTFVPGQTISGKVVYTPQAQVDIDSIIIICKGTCFTKIRERHSNGNGGQHTKSYPEKIILFRDMDTIFRGPHTIQSGRYEWPFRFQLPLGAIFHRKSSPKDNLFQLGEQGLPPSFKLVSEKISTPPEAEVSYKLKVKINPGRMMHSTECVRELPIWPASSTPLKAPLPLDGPCQGDGRFKSKALRPTQHSFKEKMSHVFTSDPSLKTPEINIAVSFKMPRSVGATQLLPLEVSCKYTKTGANDPDTPSFVVDDCHIYVKAYVEARAMGSLRDHLKDGKQTIISHNIPGKNSLLPLDGTFVPLTAPLTLADMTRHVHNLVPSFKTFTIFLYYKMVVKVNVRHIETGHRFQFESKYPFEILSSELPTPAYTEPGPSALYPQQLAANDQASSSLTAPPEFRDELAPPSYNSGDVWRSEPDAKRVY